MAIPFVFPTDNEGEIQGQQLEQLMLDLYAALQQVLRSRNAQQHPTRNHRLPRRAADGSREHPMVLVDSDLSRLPLPDLVLSAVEQLPEAAPQVTVSAPSSPTRDAAFQFPECSSEETPVPSPRPRPRRRKLVSESGGALKKSVGEPYCKSCNGHFGQAFNARQWASVGANLRNIADDFHASKTKAAEIEKSRLSTLSPPFGGPGAPTDGSTDSLLSLLIPARFRETLWTTVALYVGWRLVSCLR